jgi:hypothetical protein
MPIDKVCGSCRFFELRERDRSAGRCRRMPPIDDHRFPWVFAHDWCGEWKIIPVAESLDPPPSRHDTIS